MNAIQKTDSEEVFQIDLSRFTDVEQLLAKMVLARKGRSGLECRMENLFRSGRITDQEEMILVQLGQANTVLKRYESQLYRDMAKALKISPERAEEITQYVYEKETNL